MARLPPLRATVGVLPGRFVGLLIRVGLRIGVGLLTGLLVPVAGAGAQTAPPEATYRVVFDATWSAATHPVDHPGGAHFSSLIGGTHAAGVSFWAPGTLASGAIEDMAELGAAGRLRNRVQDAIATGQAGAVLAGPGISSPGDAAISFTATGEHHRVTLVTMVAPSPDWFVGVHDLDLRRNGAWVDELVVELFAYDAGTDSGATFTAADQDTQPPRPITRIDDYAFADGTPLGTFTFTRLPELEAPPLLLGAKGRFSITARFATRDGVEGVGQPVALTTDTGYFWFFDEDNVELVVKIIDACRSAGHFWVFAGGLTDVEVEIEVIDTLRGGNATYGNVQGRAFVPIQDTRALATCP